MPKANVKQNLKIERKYIFILVLFVLLFLECSGEIASKLAVIEVGENVTIQCNVTFERISANWKDVINVLWMWKPQNETEWILLNNSKTFDLFETSQTQKEIPLSFVVSTLTLISASVNNSGRYGCFFDENPEPVDETDVQIGYSPDVPTQLSCELNGRLTSLTCSWYPGRETHLPTEYYLYQSIELDEDFQNISWPAQNDHVILNVAKSYTFLQIFQVEAVNSLNSKISKILEIIPHNHVKTSPPHNVEIQNNNKTAPESQLSSLVVTWNSPDVSVFVKLLYRVRYRQNGWDVNWITESTTNKLLYVLRSLSPYTTYDFQVAAKPDSYETFTNGSWSDWSDIVTYSTALQIPSQYFSFDIITATLRTSTGGKSIWEIEATWHIYSNPHEPGFYYKISYDTAGTTKQHQLKINQAHFTIETNDDITMTGKYCNDLGCSSSDRPEVISVNDAPLPVENLTVKLEANEAIINWKIESFVSPEEQCIVHLYSYQRSSACFSSSQHIDDDGLCQTPVSNLSVTCSHNQAVIEINLSACLEYYATVRRLFETGVKSIITVSPLSSPQSVNPPPMTVSSFSASDQSTAEKYAIKAEWHVKESLCSAISNDTFLSVMYSPIAGSECSNSKNCTGEKTFFSALQNCSSTSHLLATNLYGKTRYKLSLGSCCKSGNDESKNVCFPDETFTDVVETAVGAPGVPLDLSWAPGNPLLLSWLPPKHPNGNLDGYFVFYSRTSERSFANNSDEMKMVVTPDTSVDVPIECLSISDNSTFLIQIQAYNIKDGQKFLGTALEQEAPLCNFVNPDSRVNSFLGYDAIALLIGLATSVLILLAVLGFSLYHRKSLKRSIRKYIWPTVPSPIIMVSVSSEADTKGKEYKDVYDDSESYSNSAYSSNRHMFHNEVTDDLSCVEIADNIREFSRCKCADNNNLVELGKKEFGKSFINDVKEETKFGANEPASKELKTTTPIAEVFSHALNVTPLSQEAHADTYPLLTPDSSRSTATWRTLFYPTSTVSGGSSGQFRRPHSFAGSSGSSFFSTNYVKNFVKPNRTPDSGFEKPLTSTTTSFQEESDKTMINLMDGRRNEKCRRVSWYEGCSTFKASHTPPSFNNDPCYNVSEIDSSSPYVTLPSVSTETYMIDGTTLDSTSDDYCFPQTPISEEIGIKSDTGTDFAFSPSRQAFPSESSSNLSSGESDRAELSGYVSNCNSPDRLSDFPLLQSYSPTYTYNQNDDSYVSMNEALSSSEQFRIDPSSAKSENESTVDHFRNFNELNFNFDEPYVASTSSNAASYVLERESVSPSFSTNPQKVANSQTDVASYVTSADFNVLSRT